MDKPFSLQTLVVSITFFDVKIKWRNSFDITLMLSDLWNFIVDLNDLQWDCRQARQVKITMIETYHEKERRHNDSLGWHYNVNQQRESWHYNDSLSSFISVWKHSFFLSIHLNTFYSLISRVILVQWFRLTLYFLQRHWSTVLVSRSKSC